MLPASLFEGYLTLKEAGNELGVAPNTARKYIDRLGFPLYKSQLDMRLVLVRAADMPKIKEAMQKSVYEVGKDSSDL